MQRLTSNPGKPAKRRRRAEGIDSEPDAVTEFAVRPPRRDSAAAAGRAA